MTSQQSKSAILITFGVLSLSISMAIAKHLDSSIPTTMVVFVRNSFGLLFFIPIFIKKRHCISLTNNISLHIIRIILGVFAMLCTYYTYRNLPIAFATSVGMTMPMFITTLSGLILKEYIGYKKWGLITLGYIGALIIIKPISFAINAAIVTALIANALAATCIVIIKILSRKDSVVTIMLFGNVGIFVVSFCLSFIQWHVLNFYDLILLSLTGLLGLITQICTTTAIKLTSPSFIAPFEYTRLLFAMIIGFVLFDEVPEMSTLIGMSIVVISTYTMAISKQKIV